ncbi:MAG: hypothetical protein KDJ65_12630 [Anaerolineae bacterium]|nr:hypothetical protein [Anaerolineae bacterium]
MEFRKYFVGVVVLVIGLLLTATMAQAQQPEYGEVSVVVPASGQTTVQFDTFCLEVSKAFPAELNNSPSGRAAEGVMRVLKTAIEEGVAESDPLATQLAIWYEIEGDWSYPEDQVSREAAQQLIDQAANMTLAPIEPEGTALDQAIADGTVSVSSDDFTSVDAEAPTADDDPYHGTGTLTITNNTDQDVTVYFPFGLVFESASDSEQDMVAFAAEIIQEATPTPTVENTVEPTVEVMEATVEATGEPTVEVMATVEPTTEMTETMTVDVTPTVEAADSPANLPQTGGELSSQMNTALMFAISGIVLVILGFFAFLFRKAGSYRA